MDNLISKNKMKKLIMLFVCGLVFTATSCVQDEELSSVAIQEETGIEDAAKAPLVWNYYPSKSWSTSSNTYARISCESDHGTNNSSKRAVVTVTNNSTSTDDMIVEVYPMNTCTIGSTPVTSFGVPVGANRTGHVLITGYTENKVVVYVRPSSGLFGSYSGTVLYGYEYWFVYDELIKKVDF